MKERMPSRGVEGVGMASESWDRGSDHNRPRGPKEELEARNDEAA